MKIKILKDIPGLEKDSIHERTGDHYVYGAYNERTQHRYYCDYLVKYGYAEEVKQIDIEAIRQGNKWCISDWNNAITFYKDLGAKEIEWFSAYRVVSEVIRQLNGELNTVTIDENSSSCSLSYDIHRGKLSYFFIKYGHYNMDNLIPLCADDNIAQKVIDLCQPELLILFNIK